MAEWGYAHGQDGVCPRQALGIERPIHPKRDFILVAAEGSYLIGVLETWLQNDLQLLHGNSLSKDLIGNLIGKSSGVY